MHISVFPTLTGPFQTFLAFTLMFLSSDMTACLWKELDAQAMFSMGRRERENSGELNML